jgi:hypothetical protein
MKLLPRIFDKRVRISSVLTLMAYNDFAAHLENTPDHVTSGIFLPSVSGHSSNPKDAPKGSATNETMGP